LILLALFKYLSSKMYRTVEAFPLFSSYHGSQCFCLGNNFNYGDNLDGTGTGRNDKINAGPGDDTASVAVRCRQIQLW
jgi:hypothetical protein